MVAQPPPAPVIDPELAEMAAAASRTTAEEVRAAGESIAQRLLRTVLQKRENKGRPTQGPASVPKPRMSANRAMARAVKSREAPDRSRTPHARLGSGAKLKKSQSQINWEFREAARQALSGIKLVNIQVHCPELKYVVRHPGVRTVWQLSQLDTATVHAIPGFGPKRRQAVAKYLREHQVPCKWVP